MISPLAFPPSLGRLSAYARAPLLEGETLLERLPNLSRHCGGAALWIKRDDAMPLATGGNKVRQLEFYLGAAQEQKADSVLITGAVQSNFARLTAAAARKLGMECHIQLEARVDKSQPEYHQSGNVLLEHLFGANLYPYAQGEDEAGADQRLEQIAAELRSQGRKPYVIHLAPAHPPLGALGYVVAAQELLTQLARIGQSIGEIVLPSGSGNTHAGLLFGLRALGSSIPVRGICVRRSAAAQRPRLEERCLQIAALLGIDSPVSPDEILLDDGFLAPGYGLASAAVWQAILLAARSEGLILDPIYTGKTMAGFLERVRAKDAEALLFIHTGGTASLFAYGQELTAACAP